MKRYYGCISPTERRKRPCEDEERTAEKWGCPVFRTALFFVLWSDRGMEGSRNLGRLTGTAERNKGNDRRETAWLLRLFEQNSLVPLILEYQFQLIHFLLIFVLRFDYLLRLLSIILKLANLSKLTFTVFSLYAFKLLWVANEKISIIHTHFFIKINSLVS